jgi:hypothetical protein
MDAYIFKGLLGHKIPVLNDDNFWLTNGQGWRGNVGRSICCAELVLHYTICSVLCGLRWHNLLQHHCRSFLAFVDVAWLEVCKLCGFFLLKKFDLFIFWQIVTPENHFLVFRCSKFYLWCSWTCLMFTATSPSVVFLSEWTFLLFMPIWLWKELWKLIVYGELIKVAGYKSAKWILWIHL